MGNQKYATEFREEAVRQILERGYSVKEVADNLEVSGHSLYKWVREACVEQVSCYPNQSNVARSPVFDVFAHVPSRQQRGEFRKQGRLARIGGIFGRVLSFIQCSRDELFSAATVTGVGRASIHIAIPLQPCFLPEE